MPLFWTFCRIAAFQVPLIIESSLNFIIPHASQDCNKRKENPAYFRSPRDKLAARYTRDRIQISKTAVQTSLNARRVSAVPTADWTMPFKNAGLYSDFSMLSILSSSFFKTFWAKLRPPTPKATAKATHRAATTRRNVVSTIFAAMFSWLKEINAATT